MYTLYCFCNFSISLKLFQSKKVKTKEKKEIGTEMSEMLELADKNI